MTRKRVLPRPNIVVEGERKKRCFELAGMVVMNDQTWTLVHGLYYGTISHAWAKRKGIVYDAVMDQSFKEREYLSQFNALEIATFEPHEIWPAMERFGETWDFWVDRDTHMNALIGRELLIP